MKKILIYLKIAALVYVALAVAGASIALAIWLMQWVTGHPNLTIPGGH